MRQVVSGLSQPIHCDVLSHVVRTASGELQPAQFNIEAEHLLGLLQSDLRTRVFRMAGWLLSVSGIVIAWRRCRSR